MKVKFEMTGFNEFKKILEGLPAKILDELVEKAIAKAGTCPVHGEASKVVEKDPPTTGKPEGSHKLSSCCEEQQKRVMDAYASVTSTPDETA